MEVIDTFSYQGECWQLIKKEYNYQKDFKLKTINYDVFNFFKKYKIVLKTYTMTTYSKFH